MRMLNDSFKKAMFYFSASFVLTIALPIFLKNAWACLLGVAAMALFGYQAYTYYRAAKNNDFVRVVAKCVNAAYNDLGAATYAKRCTFEPMENQPISGNFELQIVNDGRRKSSQRKNMVGTYYEFIFQKSALNEDDKNDTSMFTNATLITYGPAVFEAKLSNKPDQKTDGSE